jgi:hypothetical protein
MDCRWTIPKTGILEFDYVSTKRPSPIHQALSTHDLRQLLVAMTSASTDDERLDLVRQQSVDTYFNTEQVCKLLILFSISDCQVEAAVILHPRVTDLEHYLKALMMLLRNGGRPKQYADGDTPSVEDDRQILQILRRIGWLNIWNPLAPDVMYRY